MERRNFIKLSSMMIIANGINNSELIGSTTKKIYTKDSLDINNKLISSDKHMSHNDFKHIKSIAKKLYIIKKIVGHGNFNIISFDQAISCARWSRGIKRFTKHEIDIMESYFEHKPSSHGFYGQKTCKKITTTIKKKEVIKIPYSGHYLFKSESKAKYERLRKDVGNSLILTSGVRSVVKQMSLFFNKLVMCNGNLSEASRSIAPPAYSFHSLGDFDVGKKGYGLNNFTAKFANTEVFKKIKKLKYIDMRYTVNNLDGVRYEPWHIKII
jgi:zinc D-Ala-D-Ala carboxypeptidase